MNCSKSVSHRTGLILGTILLGIAALWAGAQSAPPQAVSQPAASPQKQLDRLRQLDEQLQNDRDALQQAVDRHGSDSDEADRAEEVLARDRAEYRKLRRSLDSAGVDLPPSSEFCCGNDVRMTGPGSARTRGYAHHCGHCWQEHDGYCCHQQDDAYCCRGH